MRGILYQHATLAILTRMKLKEQKSKAKVNKAKILAQASATFSRLKIPHLGADLV